MTFDELANLSLQPALGPPGPRILALLAVAGVAATAWLYRAAAQGWALVSPPRPQAIPVEVPQRRVRARRDV
jgi:hypothetical protein